MLPLCRIFAGVAAVASTNHQNGAVDACAWARNSGRYPDRSIEAKSAARSFCSITIAILFTLPTNAVGEASIVDEVADESRGILRIEEIDHAMIHGEHLPSGIRHQRTVEPGDPSGAQVVFGFLTLKASDESQVL